MSLKSTSSKCSDMQKTCAKKTTCLATQFFFLCNIDYINCLQDAAKCKKTNLMLGLKNLHGNCNKDCHKKFLQGGECISCS